MKQKKRRAKSPRVQQKNLLRRRKNRQLRFRLITVAAAAAAAVVTVSGFFHAEEFVISGETRYKKTELLSTLPVKQGDNLIFLDKHHAVSALQTAFPYLDEIVLDRKFPDTLEIQLTERKPVIAVEQDKQCYLLDATGKVLEKRKEGETGSASEVIGVGEVKLKVGSAIPKKGYEKLWAVLDFLELMRKYDLGDRVNSIDITKSYEVSLKFDRNYRIEFGSVDDKDLVEYKIQFLQAVLKKESLPMTGIIDLTDGEQARYRPFTGEDKTSSEKTEEIVGQPENADDEEQEAASDDDSESQKAEGNSEKTGEEDVENNTGSGQNSDENGAEPQENEAAQE